MPKHAGATANNPNMQKKNRRREPAVLSLSRNRGVRQTDRGLTLASFKPALRLIDDVYAALTAHNAAVAVALFERTERVCDLHDGLSSIAARERQCCCNLVVRYEPKGGEFHGGRYWDRTSDPFDVNEVLYR